MKRSIKDIISQIISKTYLLAKRGAEAPHMGAWGVFLLCLPAAAQHPLSLSECIALAEKNNVAITTADNNLQGAKEQKSEAFTKYFPTVSASAQGFISDESLVQMSMMGMDMNMVKNGLLGGVSATMPLFAGGQIINGNKLASVNVDANTLQRRKAGDNVRLTTEQYYWQIIALRGKLKTIDAVEKQLESIRKDVDAAVKAGVNDRNDLLQVNLRQNEIKTLRLQLENAISISLNLLAQHIGMASEGIDISDSLSVSDPKAYYVDPQSALANTTDHALLEVNVKAADLQKKLEVGKNLPTVAIGGGYFYNDLMDKDQTNLIGFATVSIPISGWWGGSHAIKKKKLELANARDLLSDSSEKLIINMKNKWNSLDVAYHQVAIAQESIDQSEENLRLFNDYYRAGTRTMSDLLDAQTLYAQSCDKYVEVATDYRIKLTEYMIATGR